MVLRHLVSQRIDPEQSPWKTIRKRMPASALFDPKIVVPAIGSAFVKLNPRIMIKNPVMFVLEVVTALTTVILIRDGRHRRREYRLRVSDRAVAVVQRCCSPTSPRRSAEGPRQGAGRRRCGASARRRRPKLLSGPGGSGHKLIPSTSLRVGDVVLVEAGDIIPSDGEVIEGIASVN